MVENVWKFRFFVTLIRQKVLKSKSVKPYIPDFKTAFEHFCIHAGGRAVLDAIENNLRLEEWHMEPSRMTLHRFGNTSSSSLWYSSLIWKRKGGLEEETGSGKSHSGPGFKCNSAVWKALREIPVQDPVNPWTDCIENYPVKMTTG